MLHRQDMGDVALMWLELGEQGCWAQSRNDLPTMAYAVDVIQSCCSASMKERQDESHLRPKSVWSSEKPRDFSKALGPRSLSRSQSFLFRHTTNSQRVHWAHHMVVTELVTLPRFLFLFHHSLRSLRDKKGAQARTPLRWKSRHTIILHSLVHSPNPLLSWMCHRRK